MVGESEVLANTPYFRAAPKLSRSTQSGRTRPGPASSGLPDSPSPSGLGSSNLFKGKSPRRYTLGDMEATRPGWLTRSPPCLRAGGLL